ncbi:prephenate dehydrogenase [Nocardioides sp. MAH-18]|uniref:Prephenate dehydrogenase n=1 Tax=Nocardioides agri TaxID=2682843 RepID=A0A6L6XLY5_9ACTN|nr:MULTISPECIES: prephenate dehydrogenase [unclassified Nocardioides]MBA2956427.1 prephenate dehydrogenase [Nocardioides sp. CGMCC 1.13656]MVQ47576.1 prephenate dehydrogenase [Nocardioides sp. MAH-18]
MSELVGPVEVVGTGLLGTSVALACRRAGLEVLLTDVSAEHVRTAAAVGAGRPRDPDDRPELVVVAVPPAHLGAAIADALRASDAVVTDVGSVKAGLHAQVLRAVGPALATRYVGSHPMAGSERSGPLAASYALFDGRPWAITPHEGNSAETVALVEELVDLCGAVAVRFTPEEHDRAVARTSHVPHLLASLVAARLAEAPAQHLALSGQGVRDVTRVAAGDPALYGQIVTANAEAVLGLLHEVRGQLDSLISAISEEDGDALAGVLLQGVAGTRAIPGKHGGPVRPTASVFVSVPDEPGVLARLFAAAGEADVNVEDVRIDHDLGRAVGLVELVVDDARGDHLQESLESQGWVTHR